MAGKRQLDLDDLGPVAPLDPTVAADARAYVECKVPDLAERAEILEMLGL